MRSRMRLTCLCLLQYHHHPDVLEAGSVEVFPRNLKRALRTGDGFRMSTLARLSWAMPVTAAVAMAFAIGCSSEPEVREVEVVKEVPVQVVVTATPGRPIPTATPRVVVREVEVVVTATPGRPIPTATPRVVVREVEVVVTATPGRPIPTVTPIPLPTNTPTPTPAVSMTQTLSAGFLHTCALRENGDAVCWGDNRYGQSNPPGGRFAAISADGNHTCALRENGDAACWGANSYGQSDAGGRRFAAISAGGRHTCALRENGTGLCWGGLDSSADQVKMLPLDGPFTAIAAGFIHTCALRENGDAACWGDNRYGQVNTPYGISFTAIAAGEKHTCALRENGSAVCWGDNQYSQASPPEGRFAQPVSNSITRALPNGSPYDSFDAASILARFSTADAFEGERRAAAVGEIITRYESGRADTERILDLLHTLLPELSTDFHRLIAADLEYFFAAEADTSAVDLLAEFISGHEINGHERIAAAKEMTSLYESGYLDSEAALGLMDIIAPELSIAQRRQAAAALARLAADDDWNDEDRMAAASEVFRLATGVPLNAQQRIDAAIDSAGVAVRIFDTGGNFEDRDIDKATEIIKQAVRGNLTTQSIRNILGF